ncbi:murein L,D-transpeptidase family protein [Labrenzia sp. PHM005]|uniref:L,D-transpeptidase family protein n=1 Tax=Labrenzia sp. PHM005 TaxID=2590016 RepID=UPI00113FE37C|nr:murein L,D-transpeptidase family protein [Labrenzia sp. PHM005]QDG75501.1 murein L,D-transpeptidase [Labrenzia sp. PHM005]
MIFGRFPSSADSQRIADTTGSKRTPLRIAAAVMTAGFLAGCQADEFASGPNRHKAPVNASIKRKMTDLNMSSTSPIMIRIFKEESELEVWKKTRTGKFKLLEEFEICKWSGKLGPKFKEGDRQAPEGFYEITPSLMNPKSSYHLAFNLGYPNKYDRSHNRTGSHLMVHGACSSRGCYAMTDAQVTDIYALARDSFKGGQRTFQVQAFPFRMTAENMARHRNNEHIDFWRMLKTGYDHFEVTNTPPKISVCEKKYVFDATTLVDGVPFRASSKCPAYEVNPRIAMAVQAKQNRDDEKFQKLAARMDAKEELKKRWETRQKTFANAISAGEADAPQTAATETAAAPATPAPITASPAEKQPVETAYAAKESAPGRSATGFFKRWIPFGSKAAEAGVGPIATEVVPAAKP